MIIVFTKLRSDRPLYKRDLLHVACAEPNSLVQYTYRQRNVDNEIWNDTKRIQNQEAVIVFIEEDSDGGALLREEATHADERCAAARRRGEDATDLQRELEIAWAKWANAVQRYHPLRKVIVRAAEKDQDTINITLALGDFVDYPSNSGAKIIEFTDKIKTLDAHPALHRDHAKLVIEADTPSLSFKPATGRSWTRLVQHMVELRGMERAVLFSIRSAHDPDQLCGLSFGKLEKNARLATREGTDLSGSELKSGTVYSLRVHVIYGRSAEKSPPALRVVGPVADVLGPVRRQRSAGEEAEYTIVARASLAKTRGWLWLRSSVSDDPHLANTAINYESPEVVEFVSLSPNNVYLTAIVIMFSLGTVIAALSPENIAELGFAQGPWLPGMSSDADRWSLWCKAVGAIMLAVGAFLGFRRLPPER